MYRSALFVDVDNFYSCLRDVSAEAANEFVRTPSKWLAWLANRGNDRLLFMRNAYVNPAKYSWVREDFLRAGFRVAECPSLTKQGKSSADAHIILDVVDALVHPAGYDEFILMSSDADFTPLVRRIREHGRRVMVVAPGDVSLAYAGCADEVILQDEFMREALEVEPQGAPVPSPGKDALEELLDEMAKKMVEKIKTGGDLKVPDLPRFFRLFSAFTRESNWLGFGTVKRLVEAIVSRDPALDLVGGDRVDWRVSVKAVGQAVEQVVV